MWKLINLLLPVFFLLSSNVVSAQMTLNPAVFQTMSPAQRFQSIFEYDFSQTDSASFSALYQNLHRIAKDIRDFKALFALKFRRCYDAPWRLSFAEEFQQLKEMEAIARKNKLEIEQAVVFNYLTMASFYAHKSPLEPTYAGVLESYRQFEEVGFDKIPPYPLDQMLCRMGKFLFELEDDEQALEMLKVGERFIQPTVHHWPHYILVLNAIQKIHQRHLRYDEGIRYAERILRFVNDTLPHYPDEKGDARIWQGISSIHLASMLTAKGNFLEGEKYALQGFELAKGKDLRTYQAEYDALIALIPLQLELKKIDEAEQLLHHAEELRAIVGHHEYNVFKNITLYDCYSKLYEMKGDFGKSVRYARLAEPLRDSLNHRNDARKFDKIKLRHEAEKYNEQIQLVENEKELQTWLRNAALVILALAMVVVYGWFQRMQYLRRQQEVELETAKANLNAFTNAVREKSDLVANLRLEVEKLTRLGERSEYLEQLTHSTILTEKDWIQFRDLFEKVYPQFIENHKSLYPNLTPAETRLLVLEKLNLSTQEMANMLGVSKNTIHQTSLRLRRKMNKS